MKQITLSPALTALAKDVFGPSAKLLGKELKTVLKETIDAVRDSRQNENLRNHIAAVIKKRPQVSFETLSYAHLDSLSDWMEGAQDVGEEDPRATVWRRLLEEIVEGRHVTSGHIAILKQVDAAMAEVFLKFQLGTYRRFSKFSASKAKSRTVTDDAELFQAKRLEKLGLLERDYKRTAFWLIGILGFGSFVYVIYDASWGSQIDLILQPKGTFGLTTGTEIQKIFLERLSTWVRLGLVFTGAICMYRVIARSVRQPRFAATWTGQEILKHAAVFESSATGNGAE